MADSLEEDIRALLDSGTGDQRILKQILRAAANGELISNRERSYVQSLVEKHSETAPDAEPAKAAQQPYVVESKPKPDRPRNSRPMVVAGAAAAVAVAIAVAAFTAFPAGPGTLVDPEPEYFVGQDSDAYGTGDFVLVEGLSDRSPGEVVRLQILDSKGRQLWSEDVAIRADGSYSALVLAGGDGWTSGTHVIVAAHGDGEYRSEYEFTD